MIENRIDLGESVNYFDLAAGDARAFPIWGAALAPVRKQILFQIHFGADDSKGGYGWSLKLEDVKRSVEWQLDQLKTDYIDYGFIHCQDEAADWESYQITEERQAEPHAEEAKKQHHPAGCSVLFDRNCSHRGSDLRFRNEAL